MPHAIHIPKEGEIWRINFSRVEWNTHIVDGKYIKDKDNDGKIKPEQNWVWSPQGLIDMHQPQRWGYLQFATTVNKDQTPTFEYPSTEEMKDYLWLIFYKQRAYKKQHKSYAKTLSELGLPSEVMIDGVKNVLSLEATTSLYLATIQQNNKTSICINNEGLTSEGIHEK